MREHGVLYIYLFIELTLFCYVEYLGPFVKLAYQVILAYFDINRRLDG